MAVTPNLNLYKPSREDYISVTRDISENMDKIDTGYGNLQNSISGVDDTIGIVVNGNTSSKNITAGQFVIVKNSTISGVTDGLYTAVNNVASETALVAADLSNSSTGDGGLNALNSKIETKTQITFTNLQSGWTIRENNSYQIGNVVYIDINMLRSTSGAFQQLMDLSDDSAKYCPSYSRFIPAVDNTNDKPVSCLINSAGRFNVYGVATSCTSFVINGCFVVK